MAEVLGIGSAIVDHLLPISEEFLETVPGEKWGTEIVTHLQLEEIIQRSGVESISVVGGSCSNAIKGLAGLGHDCAMTGKVGNDANGERVLRDLKVMGVEPNFVTSSTPTGQVVSLVTPDGKRTLRSYMGASAEFLPSDLDPQLFEGVKLVHIEGYTILVDELTREAMKMAKKASAAISFDLASFEIVDECRQTLLDLVESYVDILFANADEASSLTYLSGEHSCRELNKLVELPIVMLGADGCWVGEEGKARRFPAFPVEPLDTTGAGDLFASGFLHGWLSNHSLEKCAEYGARVANAVVQVMGAEIPVEAWSKILR